MIMHNFINNSSVDHIQAFLHVASQNKTFYQFQNSNSGNFSLFLQTIQAISLFKIFFRVFLKKFVVFT